MYKGKVRELAAVACVGFVIGVSIVEFSDEIRSSVRQFASWPDLPSTALGMAGGLSFYLWKVTEGQPFRCGLAILHTALGAFFGLMGAKAASGVGANEQLKTVASGIGGGMGPKAIDHIERLMKR